MEYGANVVRLKDEVSLESAREAKTHKSTSPFKSVLSDNSKYRLFQLRTSEASYIHGITPRQN